MKSRLRWSVLIVGLLAALMLAHPEAVAADSDSSADDGTTLTPPDALGADAEVIAHQYGLTVDDVRATLRDQAEFAGLIGHVREAVPNVADAWYEKSSGAFGVSFVGAVPPEARDIFANSSLEVNLVAGAPMSETDLEALQRSVDKQLDDADIDRFTTSANPGDGTVSVTVQRNDADAIPQGVAGDPHVRIEFLAGGDSEGDVQFLGQVRGGARIRDTGSFVGCTTGFTVKNGSTGVEGVASAGHCYSMDEYLNFNNAAVYGLNFQGEHVGEFGDFEWYTTAEDEVPDFWSGVGIRDVTSVVAVADFYHDQFICSYGRTTDLLVCGYLWRQSVTCHQGGYTAESLTAVDASLLQPGDSGGPWFIGYAAAGLSSCTGTFDGKVADAFGKAARLPGALGIHVQVT